MNVQGSQPPVTGTVYLVGAGPGAAGLLTVRARDLIESADVVVYDRLVSDEVRACIGRGTRRIFVGKRDGRHHLSQVEINTLLVRLARRYAQVVRLKGGDPFVFGRGSEEAAYLVRYGVAFEVVPGVTAATACAAYAGIPLTERDRAQRVCFVAGRCARGWPADMDWAPLADSQTTLVVYMGVRQLPELVDRLVRAGRAPTTPASIIENGTLPSQRVYVTTLAALPDCAADQHIQPPAMIVIGEVVRCASQLAWYVPPAEHDEVLPLCEVHA